MELIFDIDQDEMPIFLAETDEHLQVLDEGLIQLEQSGDDTELVQALFRAAHTLKGSSGMIGHRRMVTVTHALENALDGVRKQQVEITTNFVNLCLEAVDALRLLRNEVTHKQQSDVDVENFAERFAQVSMVGISGHDAKPVSGNQNIQIPVVQAPDNSTPEAESGFSDQYKINVVISKHSIASAARAFQLLIALQDLGEISNMEPSQEEIETAKPVFELSANLLTDIPLEQIQKSLTLISELESVSIQPLRINQGTPEKLVTEVVASEPPEQSLEPKNIEKVADPQKAITVDQKPSSEKMVRTSVERLDNLMNLVGELITDRNRLYQVRSQFQNTSRSDQRVDRLSETVTHIGRITDQLQKEVMGIRMLPVANTFHKFPRMVRDLANKFNKKVDLVIEGEDTELDRSVIEEITDPLIHLIRNSLDHGIELPEERIKAGKPEKARILLAAHHEQGRIVLTVEDDGKGIDIERVKASAVKRGLISEAEASALTEEESVNLIFASGLSTAKIVSDISGRGVGLDIVRNNIQHLNGTINVETWPGKGSRFQVALPLTLAIVPTLLVRVSQCILAIPLITVVETLRITEKDKQSVNNFPVIVLRDHVLPLMNLSDVFKIKSEVQEGAYQHVVVVAAGKQQMGLAVDVLLGQEEVVVKSLGSLIGEVFGISSAAILGDGQVILILDVQDLFKHANLMRDRKL
jgi:two-component system chemotaxis sensor kinase CheA